MTIFSADDDTPFSGAFRPAGTETMCFERSAPAGQPGLRSYQHSGTRVTLN